MKLINVSNDFSVESLKLRNKTVEFVHNNKTMENYFPQKTLASIYGVSVDNISKRLKQYFNRLKKVNSNSTKSRIAFIRLEIENSNKPVNFYDFKALTYLAYRINTMGAFKVRETISNILDTMFNVATGKTELDTQMDKVKNLYEVEEFKAGEYLQAYKHVIKFDEETANIIYNKYKISKANALNCWEILANNRALHKRADEVINTIEPRTDGSEQLKLI